MNTYHITYYAALREQRGLSEERIESEAKTAQDLYAALREQHGLRWDLRDLKVAINDTMGRWTDLLQTGDHVAFLPPVSGG